MNDHIRRGNEAMKNGDYRTALREYNAALEDPNEEVKQIANNRLQEIELDLTPVWTAAFGRYYHRKSCTAENVTNRSYEPKHWYWFHALSRGYDPCPMCHPPQTHLWASWAASDGK